MNDYSIYSSTATMLKYLLWDDFIIGTELYSPKYVCLTELNLDLF